MVESIISSKCRDKAIHYCLCIRYITSTLAWQIPWTEEPGRLQSMESLVVGHD